MNEETERFFRVYLTREVAYDTIGYLRPTLHAFRDEYVRGVREGLAEVVAGGGLSAGEYERLTGIEFPDAASLRRYLADMYAYLFEERPDQPEPPG
ncbi:hypothetical protein ACIPPM_13665 [Streptomyces sp. NPDC090119]|uniref:hypothetical protein n=1 Tax=Streptomyces sp. NPDC090119 TaxID=3365951 RepID=UPI003821CE1F